MSNGITSVDEARNALGKRLRELRQQAALTGKQLAEYLSWPASKVSKIENGRQSPTDQDILDWTRATGAESKAEALLASLHTLEVQHAEWQRVLKTGLLSHQLELTEQDQQTKLYRGFEPMTVPGLLQTPEYARARFSQAIMVHRVPNDINEAVQKRMQRQEMLYRQDKRFHFVLTESGLRNRLCSLDVMLGQLDRLMSLTSLRNVRLGIIGFDTQYVVDPRHSFWIYNSDLVRIETYSAELNLRQPHEIELYSDIFESHAAIATYGSAARAVITRVMEDLAAEADGLDENGV
ncbi:helix-turn-helix domain-containing protein [Amycolatopsis sp. cmx-8-4]|uniref:helix-turn-helix domain-containing protein n=1 Tax=Amycolatopsis sp. cmx-8-4 TaxID=2790947 RepID=UPI00397E2DB1